MNRLSVWGKIARKEKGKGGGGGENFSLFPLPTPLDQRPNNSHLRASFTCGLSHQVITRFEELGECSTSGWGGGGGVDDNRKKVCFSFVKLSGESGIRGKSLTKNKQGSTLVSCTTGS